jgi:hypothetical protein
VQLNFETRGSGESWLYTLFGTRWIEAYLQ